MTPMENAKKYFERYNKLKRTFEALSSLIQETKDEINHLESIQSSLEIARDEDDLAELKHELMEYGYIKRKFNSGKTKTRDKSRKSSKSKPFHYISSDGYHMYVGKNNYQNEDLTFKLADGGDWWFHAKNIPGSHVIVKTGQDDLQIRPLRRLLGLLPIIVRVRMQTRLRLIILKERISKAQWFKAWLRNIQHLLFNNGGYRHI